MHKLCNAAFEDLTKLFEQKIAYDRFKENQITKLHSELQEYKSDLLLESLRPILMGIIRLHDNMGLVIESLDKKYDNTPDGMTHDSYMSVISGFQEELEITLEQNGVIKFHESGDRFDPRRQHAVKKTPTPDLSLERRIAERIRPGFSRDNHVVQKERISIYILEE